MRWPWQKTERRQSGGDFSDAVVRLIEAQAAGSAADVSSTAAVEAASGALSRAFASAEIVGPSWVQETVTPGVLAQVGRDLIRNGDSMHVIRVGRDGMVRLIPRCKLALGRLARPGLLDRPGHGLRAEHVDHLELARERRCVCPLGIDARATLCRHWSNQLGAYNCPAAIRGRAESGG